MNVNNNPDSLDAQLFRFVVLAVAPAVTMDEASSLSGGRLELTSSVRRGAGNTQGCVCWREGGGGEEWLGQGYVVVAADREPRGRLAKAKKRGRQLG